METKLNAERRSDAGKGVARKLRAAGKIPAVLYGQGLDTTPLTVDSRELSHLLHGSAGSNVLVDLVVDGEEHLAIPREIQRDHIHMRAHGGSDDAENLRPLCQAHNLWLAELALGRGYVERRIRFRQRKRTITQPGPGVR